MNSPRRLLAAGLLVAASMAPSGAIADEFLIRETESLRNSLSIQDPSRLPLTLRLADLCMEDAAGAEFSRKQKLQRQALSLYEEALSQERSRGATASLEGPARLRVEFQKARILTDLGEMNRAFPLWKGLAAQREIKDIAREAALKLAEAGDVGHAAKWFEVALDLCGGGDLCSYVRFKRAWLIKQAAPGGLANDAAIAEMELALFDSKGHVREESLRDYLVFLGERGASGPALIATLGKVEALSSKLGRQHLIGELAESYFAAGNKSSGTVVLAQAQRRQPGFARLCRLSEEQYGSRDWDSFRSSLEELSGPRGLGLQASASDAERIEGEKLLRRLVIQLDGERISQAERKGDFQKAALAYIALFPKSPEKAKFQEGFLASESDPHAKLEKLAQWILEEPGNIKFREFRASIAQKAGMAELTASEMGALASLTGSREHKYLQARSLYEAKKYSEALPIFVALAGVSKGNPDSWAIHSQNLALDIMAMDKSRAGLDQVVAQASSWLDAPWASRPGSPVGSASKLDSELLEMGRIRDQALFERAVSLGQSGEALSQFMSFCRNRVFAEKSCENARVLGVQLKDQAALLEVLALMGPSQQGALAVELEGAGEFAKSADLLEKQANRQPMGIEAAFKLALLRELSGDAQAWERSVRRVLESVTSTQTLGEPQERLWVAMARDSGLLAGPQGGQSLRLLKSAAARGQVAEWLEANGKGTAESRRVLEESPVMTGPAWQKLMLSKVDAGLAAQKKIGFYGRNSRGQFEKRLKAAGMVAKDGEAMASKADAATQSLIVGRLQTLYADLATEIRESPIPAGIPEAAIPEVKAGIEEMAKPFDEKAKSYAALVQPVSDTVVTSQARPQAEPEASPPLQPRMAMALEMLRRNPESRQALEDLRDGYRAIRKDRLASYFEGRLQAGRNP